MLPFTHLLVEVFVLFIYLFMNSRQKRNSKIRRDCMASLLARYLRASQSRPVAVQFATGALVMAAGDATTQAAVERQALFDTQRNATAAVFNGGVSPALYKWYGLLDRVWPGSALRQLAPKLLLNQAVSSSLISPSFLCWSSCVEAALAGRLSAASGRAKVASDTYQRLRADVRRIVCSSFMLWLPVTPSHCRAALSREIFCLSLSCNSPLACAA